MKKREKKKLTLSKETIAKLESGKLNEVVAAGGFEGPAAYSDLWPQTTCL
jgi:hypothetical protein